MADTKPAQSEDRLGSSGDYVYEQIMSAHEGLSEDESHALNARLVLLMANQIGDRHVLENLLAYARDIGVNGSNGEIPDKRKS